MTARHTPPMSCDEFANRLADFLEREVDEPTRIAIESHALGCDDCGALLTDLRQLRVDAAELPVLAPSRDLWDDISARIDAPVIPINTGEWKGTQLAARSTHATRRRTLLRISAIAASLAAAAGLGAVTTYQLMISRVARQPVQQVATKSVPDAPQPGATEQARDPQPAIRDPQPTTRDPQFVSAPGVRPAALAKASAEQTFATEIARLETIVRRRRAQLDPTTIAIIERNLKVIDEAIAQCKGALAKDPASRFLMESLNKALENKVELLRTTAMLPSRA
jgi:hypothetical protein